MHAFQINHESSAPQISATKRNNLANSPRPLSLCNFWYINLLEHKIVTMWYFTACINPVKTDVSYISAICLGLDHSSEDIRRIRETSKRVIFTLHPPFPHSYSFACCFSHSLILDYQGIWRMPSPFLR